jgi:chromosome segregation ATPase
MSNDIGVSAAGGAGEVGAVVEKSEQQLKAEADALAHRLRQIAELKGEIASEQASVELLESRKQAVVERIAGLKAKLAALSA